MGCVSSISENNNDMSEDLKSCFSKDSIHKNRIKEIIKVEIKQELQSTNNALPEMKDRLTAVLKERRV